MFGKNKNKTTKNTATHITARERELLVQEGVLIMDTLTKYFDPKQAGAILTALLLAKDGNITIANLKYALDEYLEKHKPNSSDASVVDKTGGDE